MRPRIGARVDVGPSTPSTSASVIANARSSPETIQALAPRREHLGLAAPRSSPRPAPWSAQASTFRS